MHLPVTGAGVDAGGGRTWDALVSGGGKRDVVRLVCAAVLHKVPPKLSIRGGFSG